MTAVWILRFKVNMCLFLIKYLWTNFINIRRSFSYCEISILLSSRILAPLLVDLGKRSLCLHRIYSTYIRFDLIRTCLSNSLHNCIKNPSHTTRPPKLLSAIFSQVQPPFAQYLEFIVLTRLFCRRMLTTHVSKVHWIRWFINEKNPLILDIF